MANKNDFLDGFEEALNAYKLQALEKIEEAKDETARHVEQRLHRAIRRVSDPYYEEYKMGNNIYYSPSGYSRTFQYSNALEEYFVWESDDGDWYGGIFTGPNGEDDFSFASNMSHRFGKNSKYDESVILYNFTTGNHGGWHQGEYSLEDAVEIEMNDIESKIQKWFDSFLESKT